MNLANVLDQAGRIARQQLSGPAISIQPAQSTSVAVNPAINVSVGGSIGRTSTGGSPASSATPSVPAGYGSGSPAPYLGVDEAALDYGDYGGNAAAASIVPGVPDEMLLIGAAAVAALFMAGKGKA